VDTAINDMILNRRSELGLFNVVSSDDDIIQLKQIREQANKKPLPPLPKK
jgi:hypothetical protein